jgi:predicted Rossmann-fold nucleotide-binding protein
VKEIKSPEEAQAFLESPDFGPAAYRDVDLRDLAHLMYDKDFGASLFLGCDLDPTTICHVANGGAFLIHRVDDFSFPVHRARLYTPEELFDGLDLADLSSRYRTVDHVIFEEYKRAGSEDSESIKVTLARRLHDHSITEALDALLIDRKVIAIMGGHGRERASDVYHAVAKISRRLTQEGFLLVSGGGPGAMEATHVGAFFATRTEKEMLKAIESMSTRPDGALPHKEYMDEDWLHRAWQMRNRYPIPQGDEAACESIGIPTWAYGHEPPAAFATHIAKYFANSVREDGLLMVANHGVIFAPGSAGTIQEIFQDACQNHYFVAKGQCSPMILFGREYWTKTKPVWPLMQYLAQDQMYGEILSLTDDVDTIVRKMLCYKPELYRTR